MTTLRPARVRVPCSTSNLGAGFDCIGLALDRYLEATFEPGGDTLTVERAGTLAGLDVDAGRDALVAALRDRTGAGDAVRGVIRVTSTIPVGRGLGSSAAARVAGFALGAAALREPYDAAAAWVHAARAEGHPDNAAPCALGGLVAVTPAGSDTRRVGATALQMPISPAIGWAYAAPPSEVSTERARAALPRHVEHATAVDALRRMPALLRGLADADGDLIAVGFADLLHVPWRLPLIPGADAALNAAVAAGAWAATISGSGSGLIAAGPPGSEAAVAEAMAHAFRAGAPSAAEGVIAFTLAPDRRGAQLLEP